MADITITAANTKVFDNTTTVRRVQFGATVTHGQPLYNLSTDNKYYPADNDDTAAKAEAECISLTPGVASDYGYVVTAGPMIVGGTLVVGTEYYVSSNVGGICPRADLGSNDYITRLGVASTTTKLLVDIDSTGVQVP